MEYYAGIDLGGTNIKCGIVDETGKIVCQESMPTHSEKGFSDVVSTMAELVKKLSKAVSVRVKAVGVGAPGMIDGETMLTEGLHLTVCDQVIRLLKK